MADPANSRALRSSTIRWIVVSVVLLGVTGWSLWWTTDVRPGPRSTCPATVVAPDVLPLELAFGHDRVETVLGHDDGRACAVELFGLELDRDRVAIAAYLLTLAFFAAHAALTFRSEKARNLGPAMAAAAALAALLDIV